MTDFEAMVTVPADQAPTPADPCESCGTPVARFALGPMIDTIYGTSRFAEILGDPVWQEIHHDDSTPGHVSLTYRPHTPHRCQRVRAGDPEPLTGDDTDEDDL